MFALQWICALTLALVSAQPVKRSESEILVHIADLRNQSLKPGCSDDIRLYSPVKPKKECLSSAVNCTIKELDVFKNETECKVLQEAIDNLVYAMNETKWNISEISHPDCACERNPETDVKTFADNIEALVQQLNSKY